MSQSFAVAVVIALAFLAANLPFASRRFLGLLPIRAGNKGVGIELAEWLLCYLVAGLIGLLLERHVGQIYPQGWEFYATTLALFATFAFPGFVYAHLMRRGK